MTEYSTVFFTNEAFVVFGKPREHQLRRHKQDDVAEPKHCAAFDTRIAASSLEAAAISHVCCVNSLSGAC